MTLPWPSKADMVGACLAVFVIDHTGERERYLQDAIASYILEGGEDWGVETSVRYIIGLYDEAVRREKLCGVLGISATS